ncbi:helix-turn-helix domain-containing protein [Streptomyces endophytica]|uniref:Helix-turn-helix domain-containing protein n=1 Tax=Streptomyces endophytica TaxID=2991496 RepID=A0ABY6PH12_9ACTN|nr:helix-turn-helix transcriptional regulator [Streptomyces endophytica]UZJ33174.1 helix-turn-helix domain-containing protein [Streptomyces endophytica]
MDEQQQHTGMELASAAFAAEVTLQREAHGLSKRGLARAMGFDPSYISHIESGRHAPTEEFARLAEQILNAGDAIWRCWRDYHAARTLARPPRQLPPLVSPTAVATSATRSSEGSSQEQEPRRSTESPEDDVSDDSSDASRNSGSTPARIDLRGATGVQVGNGNTQHFAF